MKIIPRWEWRTFGNDLQGYMKEFEQFESAGVKASEETYILSRKSDDNIKIRFEKVDMKTMLRRSPDGIEQWTVLGKNGFPVDINQLALIFKAFGFPIPWLDKDEYEYNEFMSGIVGNLPDLTTVEVTKTRNIFIIDKVICEFAEVTFNQQPIQTIAFEHEDIELVRKLAERFKKPGMQNINYIQAMKKAAGMI